LVAAVRALFSGAVHERIVRADIIRADLPILDISRNVAKEDQDGIAAAELEFFAFNPGRPIIESTIGWSVHGRRRCVVRLALPMVMNVLSCVAMTAWNRSGGRSWLWTRDRCCCCQRLLLIGGGLSD
jgi:hypothetical protein